MEKQYQKFSDLIKKFGISEALSYKFLELRDRSHLVNKVLPQIIVGHTNSASYSSSYVASWNAVGMLRYFNPNPKYHRPDESDNVVVSENLLDFSKK